MQVPDIEGLRPTSSRVREAVFNMLGDMQGCSFLDLFAGSGVMALEALSRGASSAYSIETSRPACSAMQTIQQAWSVQGWKIAQGALPSALLGFDATPHFQVIYADPPYQQGISEQIQAWLHDAGMGYDMLIIEEASRAKIAWQEAPIKQRKYGESTLYFFEQVQVSA